MRKEFEHIDAIDFSIATFASNCALWMFSAGFFFAMAWLANSPSMPPKQRRTKMTQQNTTKQRFFTTKNLAVMGILSAIGYILYLLPKMIPIFNLPFFPPWLDLQVSDLPALLGGFALGPWATVIIIVVKGVLKMPFTSTACVGELADIVVGIAFTLPASIIYHKMKNKKSAIVGMAVGTACAVFVSALANRFVLIPFYAMTFGNGDASAGMQTIVNAVSALYSGVTVDNFYTYYIFLAAIPFNLLRCVISAVVTYFVYKPLSKILHWGRK